MDNDDQHTCGKGVAHSAGLPDAIAAVMRGMSNVLDNHIRSIDANEANGRLEVDAYRQLVAEHRAISVRLEALASIMRGYRDLPMAGHNMDALMDQASSDVFVDLVAREKDLLGVVEARVTEHEEMLGGSSRD